MFLLRGRRLRHGLLAAVIGVSLLCIFTASAQATLTWSSTAYGPQTLSPMGAAASDVQVATDAAGDSIAVWLEVGTTAVTQVAEAYRPAGGNFDDPMFISDTQGDAESLKLAMNASGQAIVIWNESVNNAGGTLPQGVDGLYAMSYPNGTFSPPAAIDTSGVANTTNDLELYDTQVGIDTAGDAVVAYLPGEPLDESGATSYPEGSVVAKLRLAGTGTSFGVGQQLNSGTPASGNNQNSVAPTAVSLAMNGAGAAVATWSELDGSGSNDTDYVYAADRPAGATANGSFTAGFNPQDDISNPSASSPDTGPPTAALDANGNALVVYDQNTFQTSEIDVEAAYQPATTTDGFNLPQPVGSYDAANGPPNSFEGIGVPQAAFDGSGNAFVMWGGAGAGDDSDSSEYRGDPLSVAYLPAGGAIQPSVEVASGDVESAQLGVDSQGRQAVLWQSSDAQGDADVEGTSRDTSSGAFATTVPLTAAGAQVDGSAPQLSMSSAGQAVGVWQVYDGAEDIVQATFGTPPAAPSTPTKKPVMPPEGGAPAPPMVTGQPPPPPPPPAVATAISSAAPFQRGRAIVLTATAPAGDTQVRWSFSDGFPNVVGTIVDGQLQTSVRLHPTGRTFTATVEVVTATGATSTSTRTFELLPQPTDDTTEGVQQELVTVPQVVTVGDAPTLLGNTACGFVTITVGQQRTSGCMHPINAVSDIPSSQLGAIQSLASTFGLNPGDSTQMTAAVQAVDGYVAPGQVQLEAEWPVVPASGASVVIFPGIGSVTSSDASLSVGGLEFGGLASGFSLDVNPNSATIPLGSLPHSQLPDIGGFPVVGDFNINLVPGDAIVAGTLQLPNWLSLAGVPVQIPVTLKATPTTLMLNSAEFGPTDVDLGPLMLNDLQLDYDGPTDTWNGSGSICVTETACLDMTPPDGGIEISHGGLKYAGATLVLNPGIPLFPGLNLTSFGFGVGLNPLSLSGTAGLSIADLVQINGRILAAFPTRAHPYYLQSDEVGSDFPSDLYGVPFSEPVLATTADVSVDLPVLGEEQFGSGYFLYEVPDFIALGGNVSFPVLSVFNFKAFLAGEANFQTSTYNFEAGASICFDLVINVCGHGYVAISSGPDDAGGAGACAGVYIPVIGTIDDGAAVSWKYPDDPTIWPFGGCHWSRYKLQVSPVTDFASARLDVPRGADLDVGSRQTITVRRGAPWPALKVSGSGAAPLVRVTGPGGQTLDGTAASGINVSPDKVIRILRYQGKVEDFTVIGLQNARPGVYTVTALPSSVPFTTIARTTNPPDAKVTAKLSGVGERRTLTYDIRKRLDQTVTFWDSNSGGAGGAPIGHVSGGGRGTLHFSAPPGNRPRTIDAQFTLDGFPAERIAVAHYQPPATTLPAPGHLKVARHGTQLTVTWSKVLDASVYEVTLTDRLTGRQMVARAHTNHLVLSRVAKTTGGRVAVRAVDSRYSRDGVIASVQVNRLTQPTSRFRALAHCKKVKKRLTCTGGLPVKHKRR